VTTLVVVVVLVMSTWHMVTVTRLRLQEAQSVAQLLADAMFQRVFDVTNAGPQDPYQAIQQDDGLKAIINAGLGSAPAVRYVLYATIVGPDRKAVVHSTSTLVGTEVTELEDFASLVDGGAIEQLSAVYHERRFEVREPILAGDKPFAAIRVANLPTFPAAPALSSRAA